MIDCIAGYHLNPWTCGIAKFNAILARHLDLPHVAIREAQLGNYRRPLLSLKLSEFSERDAADIHLWSKCHAEQFDMLRPARPDIQELFCPGTILNPARFQNSDLKVFTFGMAHKIRVPLYARLRDLLDATGKSYSVYVSTALHENTSFDGSFVVRFEELQAIFNGQVYFMGYLSDTAVFNHLLDSTYLAAFFEKGLRANNTTVNAAMECGCAVITNLDEFSPKGIVHNQNVIDISLCDRLPDADRTERIGRAAREIAHAEYGWDQLVARLRP